MPSTYFWRDTTGQGIERLQLGDGLPIVARSTVVSAEGGFTYRVTLSETWQFRSLTVTATDTGKSFDLERGEDGRWRRDGVDMPEFHPAFDIDLEISPFTNTLPIRRLNLNVRQSAEITVAYVAFPGLAVTAERQRYTRTGEYSYLFEAPGSDFSRTIQVDENGFVADYPGLFSRI